MRHTHRFDGRPRFTRGMRPDHPSRHAEPSEGHEHRRHGHRGRHGRRPFDYGELRLLVLAMLAQEPRHGYDLMKAIEERMGGSYTPSPGVIYPTLAWLEDMGYAGVEPTRGGRKLYRVTTEGSAFLEANRGAIETLQSRLPDGGPGREGVPAPVIRGMENLKLALRLKLRGGPLSPETADAIATALDDAARTIERS